MANNQKRSDKIYPAGSDLIMTGRCPKGSTQPMACMFCMNGHMTECHYPQTCDEAQCSHWEREQNG